jgi:hypothetical protein
MKQHERAVEVHGEAHEVENGPKPTHQKITIAVSV